VNHFQDVINFIPTGITLLIFFAFLKANKSIKKFEAGPIKYEAKDDPAKNDPNKDFKDNEQDKTISGVIKKLDELEAIIKNDVTERNEKFNEFETRLDAQYEFIKEAALKSCTSVIFSDNVPIIEFLDAVFTNLYLGGNGNTINRVTKRIIKTKETLETYNSELAKFRKEHKKTTPYFENAIEQIHREWH